MAEPRDTESGERPADDPSAYDRANTGERQRTATQDLADGLDLMMRAAKKAMRTVEAQNVESLGRRALESLEALNRQRVSELRSKAKRTLDPRRIEEIAEEAGKELLRVVERVADRVDSVVTRGAGPFSDQPPETQASPSPSGSDSETAGEQHETGKRVRIGDD